MRAKTLELSRASDAKSELLKQVGDLSGLELPNDLVLMANYIEPEKTAGGIIKPQKSLDESRYQGKVGLVLKCGPTAFKFTNGGYAFEGTVPKVGNWVVFRKSDAWETFVRGVSCWYIDSDLIKAIVDDPAIIY